jgi:hypothetical protein
MTEEGLTLYLGSDLGPFLLAQGGHIVHGNVWILWLVFHGNELHSGTAPTVIPEAFQQ